MAEASGQSMSVSMKTTVYGIKKKFPSVKNITCQELETWRKSRESSLVVLVSQVGVPNILVTPWTLENSVSMVTLYITGI